MSDLLIEIGCEELPAHSLAGMTQALADGLLGLLDKNGIGHGHAAIFYTPRRLALIIKDVSATQPTQTLERRGPAQQGAFAADGTPSKALLGFAQGAGVDVAQLELLRTDKGSWYVHRQSKPGAQTIDLLASFVDSALKALPIAKPMRWGAHTYAFLRPIHSVIVLLGEQVAAGEIFGIKIGRLSAGHRFHHPQAVAIGSAANYLDALRLAHVIADPAERRARLLDEVKRAAASVGLHPKLDPALVDEVLNLVEWPRAILCTFDRDYLAVPQEALIQTMQVNQRFFPLLDENGALSAQFIGVANIDSKDEDEIRKGYQRVIRPRFADAKFFFDEDKKSPLLANQSLLKATVFQAKLGSIWHKTERIAALAVAYAGAFEVSTADAEHAARLSKCDLMTRMVGEFPELQGVMGKRLALYQGEAPHIAAALDEIYQPRFAGDEIAPSPLGQLLAVCERADTLAGVFAVGMKPSGNKDPFALRRAALGLARTLIGAGAEIDLIGLLEDAAKACAHAGVADAEELYVFVVERLRGHYAELGVSAQVFDAVAVLKPRVLADFDQRIGAALAFSTLPEAAALAAANKRIGNILKKLTGPTPSAIDPELFESDAETALFSAYEAAHADTQELLASRAYTPMLKRLAVLREPTDRFFDGVMVMTDDLPRRANRLGLLAALRALFVRVADISLL